MFGVFLLVRILNLSTDGKVFNYVIYTSCTFWEFLPPEWKKTEDNRRDMS